MRSHNTALRRRIVKIYSAAQRIVKISDALSYRMTRASDEFFALRQPIILLCDVVRAIRRRNAVLWPRPKEPAQARTHKWCINI